jgi:hypothetical protein
MFIKYQVEYRDFIRHRTEQGKDAKLECHLEEGAPLPTVSWCKVKDEFDLMKFNLTMFCGDFIQ